MQNMNDESKKLGRNLKRIRIKEGFSQEYIARALGIDRAFISNIENGKANPTLATIARLAKAIKVSVGELLK
jgi:transcriptional regulator with XRE-family HTH domain